MTKKKLLAIWAFLMALIDGTLPGVTRFKLRGHDYFLMRPIAGADGEGEGGEGGSGEGSAGGEGEGSGEGAGGSGSGGGEKPPWGEEEENFDPKRAWELIQGLRGDKTRLATSNEELQGKVKEHEDASKSDQEKLEERTTNAEKEAGDAKREAARLRVALAKGLTETQAKRLVGDNEEELMADADELLESFKGEDEGEERPGRPRERPRPGAVPGAKSETDDPHELAKRVRRSY